MTRLASDDACTIRRTVLLADDCVGQRDLYEFVLQEEFDVVTASRGDEALQTARRGHPDVIVMDICLPGLDGLSVCRRLQEDASTLDIPVILMTGDTHPDLSTRAANVGAVAVLRKPCSAETLFKSLAEALHGGRRRGPHAAAALSETVDQAASAADCPAHVLVVDDSAANREDLVALLAGDGYLVTTATNGAEALDAVARDEPDLVLLDVMMPLMNGFETCAALRAKPSTRLLPVVLITAMQEIDAKIKGLEVGADDFLPRPVNPLELQARVRSLLRLKRYTNELDSADAVIRSLALTIEARDGYTNGHCQRLAAYASSLGREVGLGGDDVAALECAGYVHDIGKVGIPDALLLKPGGLTSAERDVMKQHTVIGDRLCGELKSMKRARPIVRHHHERLDGSGYPDGLGGEDIPILAQILSVVDAFDAATTARPYKPPVAVAQVSRELRDEAHRGWRRTDFVDAFLTISAEGRLPKVFR